MAVSMYSKPARSQFVPFNSDLYTKMRMAEEQPAIANLGLQEKVAQRGYMDNQKAQQDIDYVRTILDKSKAYGDDAPKLEGIKQDYYNQLQAAASNGNLRGQASKLANLRRQAESDVLDGEIFGINQRYNEAQESQRDAYKRYSEGDIDDIGLHKQLSNPGLYRAPKTKNLDDLNKLLSEGYGMYRPDKSVEEIGAMYQDIVMSEMSEDIEAANSMWNNENSSEADRIKFQRYMAGLQGVVDQNIYRYKQSARERAGSNGLTNSTGYTDANGYSPRYMSNKNKANTNPENIELNKASNFWVNELAMQTAMGVDNTIFSGLDPVTQKLYESTGGLGGYVHSKTKAKDKKIFIEENRELMDRIKKQRGYESDDETFDALVQEIEAFDVVRGSTYDFPSADAKKNIINNAAKDGMIIGVDEEGEEKEFQLQEAGKSRGYSNDNININIAKGTISINENGQTIHLSSNNMPDKAASYSVVGKAVMDNLVNTKKDGEYLVSVDQTGNPVSVDLSKSSQEEIDNVITNVLMNTPYDHKGQKVAFINLPKKGQLTKEIQKVVLDPTYNEKGNLVSSYKVETRGKDSNGEDIDTITTGEFNDYILDGYNSVYNFKN